MQTRSYPPRHFPPSPAPSDPTATTLQHPPSTRGHPIVELKREKTDESSGEEDDILDAIAEWQQN